ncbi:DUF898 family protein [Bradyrhizobium sp. U87765 SZCCT0131]|uniref:DUF898 family protein n=1 Tax=unclassified Bradyrhizobium TaxID=2631580 RepID=UPI001BA7C94A|nr:MULTISPECIES: DUF898 family protein [unclassified Bradyrhizobium]MBR1222906.1 DUF898 family protein [Bradyrhizobium sp. U87765 SZCCT0131]MBR1262642.1 DUF898 family protein [Bradyrhizobium sp. U87765 SZCCT0134]MBR1308886.1 DUF898 family protein [Bradyrhizobium sp. U87765 SZCCT0110]MBR1318424.1 DUF898 family protein [Bradyrhizobium sp. U87765 SZCCT0109]MBR1352128.1 DUF898 family protein [Bradyrhizobium sp. U87765 SZCCT0048]
MDQISRMPPVQPPARVEFSGDRGDFRRLVTRGALLELITLGFYRFWLATDMRRHLWSHTDIDGDAPEYTGTGKELLIGFLFALAIIVPIYLVFFLLTMEAERLRAFASFPLVAFFYVFGQFAIYRARRYRLTRTVWRGVRFWMDGSGWVYALRAVLWNALAGLTLGLALPWREAALERYKMRHSYYGNLQGSFEGRGWEFFKQGWWLWLMSPIAVVVFPLLPFFYAMFKAVEWRWWLSGIRFGDVRLTSSLPRDALIGLYWKLIGWGLLLSVALVVYIVLCGLVVASVGGESVGDAFSGPELLRNISLIVLGVVGYLVYVLAAGVVARVYLMRDLWVRVAESVSVFNIEATANVMAAGEAASALGEGLADGLDVAGF